jgi:uncharacterized protein (DUF736 family)
MAKKINRPKHTPPARAKEETAEKGGNKTFDNTNRGVLFPQDKEGNENRPDLTGSADIKIPDDASPGDVVKFRLAAWEKESKAGNKFLSLNFQLPKPKAE